MTSKIVGAILSLIGAVVGAALGFFAFGWILRQGLYAIMLPGALLGFGASLTAPRRSQVRGILCGVAALAVGLFAEWHYRPFVADESLGYFLTHVGDLLPIAKIMILVGALLGYWIGKDAGLLPVSRTGAKPPPDSAVV